MFGNRILFSHSCYYYKSGFCIGIGMYAQLVRTAKGQTVQIEPIDYKRKMEPIERKEKVDSDVWISIPVEDIDKVIELLTFLKGQSNADKTTPTVGNGNVPDETEGSG